MRISRFPIIAQAFVAGSIALAFPGMAAPPTVVEVSPEQGSLEEVLQRHTANAKAKGLTPVVELGVAGCPPCSAVKESMNNALMTDAFASVYVIRVDTTAWRGQIRSLGMDPSFLPIFYALGDNGKPDGRTINGGAWGDNTPENMAPPLKAFFQNLHREHVQVK